MTIASCPRCREQVRVPEGASPHAVVCCPLCREEYLLEESLNRLPPLLIVVHPGDSERQAVPAGVVSRAEGAADEFVPASAAIDFDDELSDVAVDDTLGHDQAVDDSEFPGSPAFPSSQPFGFESDAKAPASDLSSVAARPRRRRKQRGPITTMVQMVGGGAVGLILAQLILWYLPGNWPSSNRDPFGLAAHVVKFAPFIVPAQLKNRAPIAAAPAAGNSESKIAARPPARKRSAFELTPANLDPAVAGDSGGTDSGGTDSGNDSNSANRPPPVTGNASGVPADDRPASGRSGSGDASDSEAANKSNAETVENKSGQDGRMAEKAAALDPDRDPFDLPREPAEKSGAKPVDPPARSDEDDKPAASGPETSSAKLDAGKSAPPDSASPAPPTPADPSERSVSADDIRKWLSDAEAAEEAWDMNERTDREETLRLLGQWYSALGRLGESMLLAERSDPQVVDAMGPVEQELHKLAAESDKLKYLGGYAALWLDKDREHDGTLFVGSVVAHAARGEVFETRLKVTTRPEREIRVISETNLVDDLPAGTRVLMLGSLVADPREEIAGYEGDDGQVLFGSYYVKLPGE